MLTYRILIVQKENNVALQKQQYLWFALIDFFLISSQIIDKTMDFKLIQNLIS